MPETYRVTAYNSLFQSQNKIHDDDVARKFGYSGALVAGADVYAYMTHPLVARWGLDWLARGTAEVRLIKPVYDGKSVEIVAADEGGGLALTATSDGVVCAVLDAALPNEPDPAGIAGRIADDLSSGPLPSEARPPAGVTSLAVGRVLGMAPVTLTRDDLARYVSDVREGNGIYLSEGVAHSGLLLRAANSVLKESVVLGPWIHTRSRIAHHDVLRVGETFHARGVVTANYEKKGHRFVEYDVELAAHGRRRIAFIQHVAIWQIKSGD